MTALIAMDTATVDADNSEFAVEFGGDVEFGENDDIVIEVKKSAHIDISVGPWNSNDKELTVEVADPTIAKFERGVLTGVAAGETKIIISKDGFTTQEIKITVVAPASSETKTTYTYTHGGSNGSEWATTAGSNTTAAGDAGTKIAEGAPLTLTASGTKATISMKGFTTSSDKANEWVKVTLKAADGTEVGSIMGTTPTGKVVGDYTFGNSGVITATAEFATIEISYGGGTAGKHFSITELNIVVE